VNQCISRRGSCLYGFWNAVESIYRGFATALAEKGVVTISTDVGQHEVYEAGRLLMGERLWDLMRCVDYLSLTGKITWGSFTSSLSGCCTWALDPGKI